MKNRGHSIKKLNYGLIILGVILALKLDLPYVNLIIEFILGADNSLTLGKNWLDKRMFYLSIFIMLLLFYYKPVLSSYCKLSRLYHFSEVWPVKPSVSSAQASYYFQKDESRSLLIWIINCCRRGILSLSYEKGLRCLWTLRLEGQKDADQIDRQRLESLFINNNTILIKSNMSDPNPVLSSLAHELYADTEVEAARKNGQSGEAITAPTRCKQNFLPVWVVLAALIAEIPFYNASLGTGTIGLLFIVMFSSVWSAIPALAFGYSFPMFFTEAKFWAYLMLTFAFFITLFGNWLFFDTPSFSGMYFVTAFYPALTVSMAVLIHFQPVMPTDTQLFSQIIGYRKYLAMDGYQINEEDLPWTLGMAVHSISGDKAFHYGGSTIPTWLQTDENDAQSVMEALHQSLPESLGEAVWGKQKSRGSIRHSRSY